MDLLGRRALPPLRVLVRDQIVEMDSAANIGDRQTEKRCSIDWSKKLSLS